MIDFLKKHRRAFIISLIAVCALLIGVTTAYRIKPSFVENIFVGMTAPIQSGLTNASNWVREKIDFFTSMSELYDENQRLKSENALLVMENSRLNQVDAENEALASLLETKRKYADYPYEVGQVTAVDPGNWYNRFNIDLGSKQGMIKNMVVLADGALIGRLTEVWSNYSRVDSIIDDTSGVSAKSDRTGDVGIVRGDASLMMEGLCLMEFTSLDVDIEVGDEISTSQLSSIYPPGIIIGYVVEVSHDSKGMKTAVIQPLANFSRVEYVLVITRLYDIEAED